ncbi:putative DNA-directed RNA polymerase [Bienertia sinuspersici]
MVMEAHSIWVYDKLKKRKRKVTVRVPSKVKRDRKKTEISTFVNFIHQKDAYIAMRVVKKMIDRKAPIYTVHDNFITNAHNCKDLPIKYLEVFKELGPPLKESG